MTPDDSITGHESKPRWEEDLFPSAAEGDVKRLAAAFSQAQCGPDIRNNAGFTPLMIACIYGRENVVDFLLAHGADPRLTLPQLPHNALVLANMAGHMNIVKKLRDAGASSLDARDWWTKDATYQASFEQQQRRIDSLKSAPPSQADQKARQFHVSPRK